jgi:hypothetical protein
MRETPAGVDGICWERYKGGILNRTGPPARQRLWAHQREAEHRTMHGRPRIVLSPAGGFSAVFGCCSSSAADRARSLDCPEWAGGTMQQMK